ncbi:MAG: hypothetical protein H6828_03150 [Planctomycetes bacterium]|nr:hypothetical protein [Planctomycetota bacterium]
MIELAISMVILTVCCGMLTSTITGTMHNNRLKNEQQLAVEAARGVIEDMHKTDFYDVFWKFNDDPADDLNGEGTAPGAHFAVPGLRPRADDEDGFVGEILMPVKQRPLREDVVDEDLGLPRDLNGDLRIDDADHAQDYIILPVIVRLRWRGAGGDCEFKLCTMLADIRKVE